MPSGETISTRKIAVIGVHGVGQHQPGETAHMIARQLQYAKPAQYKSFEQADITISVDAKALFPETISKPSSYPATEANIPPNLGAAGPTSLSNGLAAFFGGMGSNFLANRRLSIDKMPDEIDLAFTESLLSKGEAYQSNYPTIRLAATLDRPGEQPTTVHIHELFWSDLSHGGIGNSLAVFGQLMQLLLHVASLGRTSLAGTLAKIPAGESKRAWTMLYRLNAAAYSLLSMPILLGNFLLMLLGCLLLPIMIPAGDIHNVQIGTSALAGIAVAIGFGYFSFKRLETTSANDSHAFPYIIWSVVCGIGGGMLVYAIQARFFPARIGLLIFMEAVCLAAISGYCMSRYEKSRPGALVLWIVMLAALAMWALAAFISGINEAWSTVQWLGYLVEGVFMFLLAVWTLLSVVNLALLLVGECLKHASQDFPERRQAINTGLIATSIPAPLLLSVILFLWCAAALAFSGMLAGKRYAPVFKHLFNSDGTIEGFIKCLIDLSASIAFLPYAAIMVVATLTMLFGFGPSVFLELFPAKNIRQSRESQALGNWLDGGFRAAAAGALLALIGCFFLLPAGSVAQYFIGAQLSSVTTQYELMRFFTYFAGTVGAAAVTFIAATKWFSTAFSGAFGKLRVIVDAAIDVDNWLRERPVGLTPRMKIMARYTSLLRYLKGEGYDEIVIVAHSQGTVITVDLFRYLQGRREDFISDLRPPKFFSMGCPLRQLYALRFPALYGWASDVNQRLLNTGFSQWVNLYGSGDYVGRYLWINQGNPEDYAQRWEPRTEPVNQEFCIGTEAHTHYFDETNRVVGNALVEFIG